MIKNKNRFINRLSGKEKLKKYEILSAEANTVREIDKVLIKSLLGNFYGKQLSVGIGFQRAYGSILSGDYFDLIKLPDGNYLFVFADISGHGLPAYTTLIRLRSAITIALKDLERNYDGDGFIDTEQLVFDICTKFTDIMDDSNSFDFACVIFSFIYNEDDKFHIRFYNRSMLFPIVVRKFKNELVDIYNLNSNEKGWNPQKGSLLGSDVRKLIGDEYYRSPSCEFILYEGDSILFYSDGIVEACKDTKNSEEFGESRILSVLESNYALSPQIIVQALYDSVYSFMGRPENQRDDMTAVLIDFPPVR